MSPQVLIIVTDELGTKTIIDTQEMGPEHPLGDHVLSAIHRLQHGFGKDVDRCVKKINDAVDTVSKIQSTIRNLVDRGADETTAVTRGEDEQASGVESVNFDGTQVHWHTADGWCIDENGKFFVKTDDPPRCWHDDDHNPVLVDDFVPDQESAEVSVATSADEETEPASVDDTQYDRHLDDETAGESVVEETTFRD